LQHGHAIVISKMVIDQQDEKVFTK
jgi:hypothetical protein